jgi:hypothetical protein
MAWQLSGLSQQARRIDCERAAFLIGQAIAELGEVAFTPKSQLACGPQKNKS